MKVLRTIVAREKKSSSGGLRPGRICAAAPASPTSEAPSREALALEVLKRWRNDPDNRRWTNLLERVAWLLPGTGVIRSDQVENELRCTDIAA